MELNSPKIKELIFKIVSRETEAFFDELNGKLDQEFNNFTLSEKIGEAYSTGELVFVLGAGVGIPYNLPSWNTLLQELFLNALDIEDNINGRRNLVYAEVLSEYLKVSPLVAAGYLNKYYKKYGNKRKFISDIKENLYRNIKVDFESEFIKELVKYCEVNSEEGWVDSIITYNYDDIVEKALNQGNSIKFKSIYQKKLPKLDLANKLPIYHVHGYLPRGGTIRENNITLSEESYHEQYLNTFSWNNIVQINKFTDKTCVFVGISFTDPNLRRLLDIAAKQRRGNDSPHFLFKKRYSIEEVREDIRRILRENRNTYNIKVDEEISITELCNKILRFVEKLEEIDAETLGVNIIWVDEYNEVATKLAQIREQVDEA